MTSRRSFLVCLTAWIAALPVMAWWSGKSELDKREESKRFKITMKWRGQATLCFEHVEIVVPESGDYTFYADTYAPSDVTIKDTQQRWSISVHDQYWYRSNSPEEFTRSA